MAGDFAGHSLRAGFAIEAYAQDTPGRGPRGAYAVIVGSLTATGRVVSFLAPAAFALCLSIFGG